MNNVDLRKLEVDLDLNWEKEKLQALLEKVAEYSYSLGLGASGNEEIKRLEAVVAAQKAEIASLKQSQRIRLSTQVVLSQDIINAVNAFLNTIDRQLKDE